MATASPPELNDLAAIRLDVLDRIEAAAGNWRLPMHNPVVANCDSQGAPNQRVMALRAFDRDAMTVRFHTDARAAKVPQIGPHSAMSVLFYDPDARLQFRCAGRGRIVTDEPLVDQAWEAASLFARRCYLADPAPGSIVDAPISGLPPHLEGVKPDAEQAAPGRANFAVLLVTINRIEWLHLAHSGHRRAVFEGDSANWLVP